VSGGVWGWRQAGARHQHHAGGPLPCPHFPDYSCSSSWCAGVEMAMRLLPNSCRLCRLVYAGDHKHLCISDLVQVVDLPAI
jgi:hypothetical protein